MQNVEYQTHTATLHDYSSSKDQFTCASCSQRIVKNCVNAGNERFHFDCFICTKCGCVVGLNPYANVEMNEGILKNVYYCTKCYEHEYIPHCAKCALPILKNKDHTTGMGKHWHRFCLYCHHCGERLHKGPVEDPPKYMIVETETVTQVTKDNNTETKPKILNIKNLTTTKSQNPNNKTTTKDDQKPNHRRMTKLQIKQVQQHLNTTYLPVCINCYQVHYTNDTNKNHPDPPTLSPRLKAHLSPRGFSGNSSLNRKSGQAIQKSLTTNDNKKNKRKSEDLSHLKDFLKKK